ncbi:IclR family transcriptional regulator [Sporolactobacillus sp. THM7-4]|nr:IclR family transcriptional regulator [Sporolactobacillus sp. THM7-4]
MNLIQSVERALKILNLFDDYTEELKITEISNRLKLNKSTVHSLLKTLETYDYIAQNTETGKYRLGLKLFERGNIVLHHLNVRTLARPFLVDLSRDTGHTLHLVILDGMEGLYIDKVEGTSGMIVYSRIGRRVPLHSSAVGKVLAAFQSNDWQSKLLERYSFFRQTCYTITSGAQFQKELNRVRENDYAIDSEENERGICCIAIPIKNHLGRAAAAISISMPKAQFEEQPLENVLGKLQAAGLSISRRLGYLDKKAHL